MIEITNLLGRASSILNRVAIGSNAVGTAVVFFLIAIMNVDVVARGVFNAPFRGVVEVVIFSMILIVFLQLPDVVRVNRLTRSDGFLAIVGNRRPGLARLMTRIVDATSCLFMGLIVWIVWPDFLDAFESCHYIVEPELGPAFTGDLFQDLADATARCDYFGTPGILTAPWWPAKLAIAFSVTLCCLLFALKAATTGRKPESLHLEESETGSDRNSG